MNAVPKPQMPMNSAPGNAYRFSKPRVSNHAPKEKVEPLRSGDTMFLFDQGPKINGSCLQFTSSTTKAFKIPEPRL